MPDPTTLRIELWWMNGILAEGEYDDPDGEPQYELLDHGTGKPLGPGTFSSCRALEAYIATHHPGCKRAPLPAAPPEEVKRTQTFFALMDNPPPHFDVRHLRRMFAGQYYQWAHSPETIERLRRALGLPDLTH